jgi:acetyl-CoA acetyltransferase family protein
MFLDNTFIPYGAYWSTPFARWQGSLSEYHSIRLVGEVAREFLARREITPDSFDGVVLGITVTQRHSFYASPWFAALAGAPDITGPTISQACATSVRSLASAALEIEVGSRECILAAACDRTSNGPHVYYPSPGGPGGHGRSEDPVLGNMSLDPYAGLAMTNTAENLAAESGIGKEEQDSVTLMRFAQYQDALANDRAFQKRYMAPVELKRGEKSVGFFEADEGVHPTTAEGLERLRPVLDGGTVTYGSQTHPADGNAGIVVCTRERASQLSRDLDLTVQVLSYGEARTEKGFMPKAVVPAARQALERAGIDAAQCAAIKTHNPFAVADIYFSREMDVAIEDVNNYGSPLIWGHPQAPTGMRAIIELIEELVMRGGGYGLFSGCAGGDSAMSMVIEVS